MVTTAVSATSVTSVRLKLTPYKCARNSAPIVVSLMADDGIYEFEPV